MKANYQKLQNANIIKIIRKIQYKLQLNEATLIFSMTLCESTSAFVNIKMNVFPHHF